MEQKDLLNQEFRKALIEEILGKENEKRKDESFRRFEIYNKRQAKYIEAALKKEFPNSFSKMRKVTSINIAPRIIDETACVYKDEPERKFFDDSGNELEGDMLIQAQNLYAMAKVNERANRANRIKRFQNQCILQIVPKRDRFEMRAFHPHQLDCVPYPDEPTRAFAYIVTEYNPKERGGDDVNQRIADRDDAKAEEQKAKMRFIIWSDLYNMRVDGNGVLLDNEIDNPIQVLPFYDVSDDKEGAFWVDKGSNTIDFAIDFAVMLSDTANTNRMQSYAQGVWYGKDKPSNIELGPNNLIFVPQDPDSVVQPRFEFANPSPDLNASMELLDRSLNIHLTSEKVDPKILNSKGEARSFSSGFERLLALYEKFDASKDDLKIFADVEEWIFKMFVLWSNAYQGTTENPLAEELKVVKLPEGAKVSTTFAKPEMIQTKTEMEDSSLKLYAAGVKSIVDVVKEIYNISEERAEEMLTKMLEDKTKYAALEPGSSDVVAVPEGDATGEVVSSDAGVSKVADTALNGAQVTAMIEVVAQVASGQIPRESAVAIMEKAFLIPKIEAERLLGSAGKGFEPKSLEAPQAAPLGEAA